MGWLGRAGPGSTRWRARCPSLFQRHVPASGLPRRRRRPAPPQLAAGAPGPVLRRFRRSAVPAVSSQVPPTTLRTREDRDGLPWRSPPRRYPAASRMFLPRRSIEKPSAHLRAIPPAVRPEASPLGRKRRSLKAVPFRAQTPRPEYRVESPGAICGGGPDSNRTLLAPSLLRPAWPPPGRWG